MGADAHRAVILGLLLCSGCTADPVSRGLLVTSPHAEAAMVRADPKRVELDAGPTAADDANARAVRIALLGNYEQALRALPAPTTAERPISRTVVRANRDVIAYWQQRQRFAGSMAMPDPHVGYSVRADSTSLHDTGWHRQFGRLSQTFEVDAAGIRIRVPYDTVFEHDREDGFRGETELTLQAFAGKASQWPNTKLTAGVTALVHRSALCADAQDPRADLFAGIAHRYRRVAITLILGAPSEMGQCPGPCLVGGDLWARTQWNLLVHPSVQPTFGTSTAVWVADQRGVLVSLSPGLRFFLDPRQLLRIDAIQHTTIGEVNGVAARRAGGELTLAYRWF